MDAELLRLVQKTKGTHAPTAPPPSLVPPRAAAAVPPSRKRKASSTAGGPPKRRLEERGNDQPPAARPSFAERDLFMSASASRVHMVAEQSAPRPQAPAQEEKQQQRAEFKDMALSVERLGASELQGLSKKDQKARERERLGLRAEKDHKRPYKQLMELRKKQRAQDSAAEALAKQTGMTARKQSAELAGKHDTKRERPTDGVSLGGGVLHVSSKQIRNFWMRPTGVYSKPIWLRPGVLQLVYDDDINKLRLAADTRSPGGHVAFTRTATVYSQAPITPEDLDITSTNALTDSLRHQCPAFKQRVANVYLIEANLLGFAGEGAGLEEQCVLSAAVKWALSDYSTRFGAPPSQIVLHLDVNGTLALGDVAGTKTFGTMAKSLAKEALQRFEEEGMLIPKETRTALARVRGLEEDLLRDQYSVNYSGNDFIRAVISCLGALAPAAIRALDAELSSTFADTFTSQSALRAIALASAESSIESPALTVAIRTNGVEHRQAAVYVQRLVMGVLGLELSESKGTMRRYIVTHEDKERGLYFHPVLLEKLHKSDGAYTFDDYEHELKTTLGRSTSASAWRSVSSGTLKKSDAKFKMYMGLCRAATEVPGEYSVDPPSLDVIFARETWLMPQVAPNGKHKDYKLADATPGSHGPWWAGFVSAAERRPPSMLEQAERSHHAKGRRMSHQPYGVAIASEPVPRARADSKEVQTQVDESTPSFIRPCQPTNEQPAAQLSAEGVGSTASTGSDAEAPIAQLVPLPHGVVQGSPVIDPPAGLAVQAQPVSGEGRIGRLCWPSALFRRPRSGTANTVNSPSRSVPATSATA